MCFYSVLESTKICRFNFKLSIFVLIFLFSRSAAGRQLIAAETEITQLYAGMADCLTDHDANAIVKQAGALDDCIFAAVPASLADCAVKLRRALDHEVGMVAGTNDRDVPALVQVLDYIEAVTGAPTHPTRPIARTWDEDD